jgi:hypothetical protein
MARPLRIEYAGAHYHVTSRGNERMADRLGSGLNMLIYCLPSLFLVKSLD